MGWGPEKGRWPGGARRGPCVRGWPQRLEEKPGVHRRGPSNHGFSKW